MSDQSLQTVYSCPFCDAGLHQDVQQVQAQPNTSRYETCLNCGQTLTIAEAQLAGNLWLVRQWQEHVSAWTDAYHLPFLTQDALDQLEQSLVQQIEDTVLLRLALDAVPFVDRGDEALRKLFQARNNQRAGETVTFELLTNDLFWECNCDGERTIHPKSRQQCPRCSLVHNECPDAHSYELALDRLWW